MKHDPQPLSPQLPRYRDASLPDVLPSALAALKVAGQNDYLGLADESLAGVERIAVLLVDGLGYHQLPEAAQASPMLSAALDGELGELRALTTNFPSTTPTSLASLCVGAPPGEHGIMGFTVNVPGTNDVLTHIAWRADPDPARWQPLDTCFGRAADDGVAATVVNRAEYARSGLNRAIFKNAALEFSDDVAETADLMRRALSRSERSLVYGYYPFVDKRGHENGFASPQWLEAVAGLDGMLSRLVADLPADTALLVTADHGMLNIGDADRLDIADHPRLRDGVRVIAGDPRARYIHTVDGAAPDVIAAWSETFGERVDVLSREAAIARGWFAAVAPEHVQRVGDVVAVPRERFAIFGATESDSPTVRYLKGLHGGLTAAEMMIPLWIVRGMS